MKYLLCFFLTLSTMFTFSQCPPGNVTFSSQQEIDDFPIDYPLCHDIAGDVIISGADITNLDGLSSIQTIAGNLTIKDNSALVSLDGLSNLEELGSDLYIISNNALSNIVGFTSLSSVNYISIKSNGSLIDIDGFSALTQLTESLWVVHNPLLESINGFSSLSVIEGYLYISDDDVLVDLGGFSSLSSIGDFLTIDGNNSLVNLNGLNSLTTIGTDLSIYQNSSLTSLEGLSSLSSIAGHMYIWNNASLESLNGLSALSSVQDNITITVNSVLNDISAIENVDPYALASVTISGNPQLSVCEEKSICKYLSLPGSVADIQNNAPGCNSREEVESACCPKQIKVLSSLVKSNLCFGDNNGSVELLSIGGGHQPYSFEWSNGETSQSIYNLPAGEYCVTITDDYTCERIECYTVYEPPLIVINANIADAMCYDSKDGSIVLSVSGGVAPYDFLWDNGETGKGLMNLGAGLYCVTITDFWGCVKKRCYEVHQPSELIIASSKTKDITCFGDNDGNVDIETAGGTPPYTYQWNNGAVTQDLDALAPGKYCVVVTDAHDCEVSDCFTITEPPELVIEVNHTNESGNEFEDGTASVKANGGTPGYTYQWSNGSETASIGDLSPGTYSIEVTDANGCTKEAQVMIEKYICAYRALIASVSDVKCKGGENGKIDIRHVIHGEAPYHYEWSNKGDDLPVIWGLLPGDYQVSVTDSKNCTAMQSFTISEPEELMVHAAASDETAPNHNDGTATCYPSGGNYPYKYLWSTGEKTQSISNLKPGKYWVRVRDNFGCIATEVIFVNGATCPKPQYAVGHVDISCYGACDGLIKLTGSGALKYLWNTGDTTAVLDQLCPGVYHVEITDPDGCGTDTGFVITQPEKIPIRVKSTKLMGPGRTGSIMLDYDEDGDLLYNWTGPYGYESQQPTIENLKNFGCYHLVVTSLTTGCSADTTICMENRPDVIYNDDSKGPIVIFPNPIIGEFTIDLRGTKIETAKIELINLNGQVMWHWDKEPNTVIMHVLDKQLSPGVYFLRIAESGRQPIYKKIFVERPR